MQLQIRKSIDSSTGSTQFKVLCGLLALTPDEEQAFANFGAARLEALFGAGSVAQLRQHTGASRFFIDVNDALAFVE